MERRDFFKSIAGLFAVAAADPIKALEGSLYTRADMDLPILSPAKASELQRDFTKLTQFMLAELRKQLPGAYPTVAPAQKVGPEFPYHFGVDLQLVEENIASMTDEMITERYVLPITALMANEIKFNKAARFADLPLPYVGIDAACRVHGDGISLRGLRAFTFGDDETPPHYIHRFDVLFSA